MSALPPLVTVEQFGDWLGSPVPDGTADRWRAVLAAASGLVRAEAGNSWTNADGYLLEVPDEIVGVVCQVVERKFNNPAGAITVTRGPFSEQYPSAIVEGLFLTPAERATCVRAGGVRPSGLWVQPTTRTDVLEADPLEGADWIGVAGDHNERFDLPWDTPVGYSPGSGSLL